MAETQVKVDLHRAGHRDGSRPVRSRWARCEPGRLGYWAGATGVVQNQAVAQCCCTIAGRRTTAVGLDLGRDQARMALLRDGTALGH
jgi:hypothetical protein